MKRKLIYLTASIIGATFLGCVNPAQHSERVQNGLQGEKITVGTVQREIKKGMSGGEVLQALGSPNIVSTDEKGREVWVYDKIATDRVYSKGSAGFWIVILHSKAKAGAESTSQRTLTIIIHFDHQGKVRNFAYHSSRF